MSDAETFVFVDGKECTLKDEDSDVLQCETGDGQEEMTLDEAGVTKDEFM